MGSSPEEALIWLQQQGLTDQLIELILPVLEKIWTAAWDSGLLAAQEVAGIQADMQQQQQRRAAQIAASGAQWAGQIAATTLKLLAARLAAGAVTVAAIAALLGDITRAADIALTEATRASSAGASSAYAAAGVLYVRWLTEPGACPECEANEEAGRWPLGVPFPSGAIEPPQHPRCRCAIVPA